MLIMHQLAGVLLDMDALDPDPLGLVPHLDLDRALTDQRMVELADLIALRQIGVEIVLAIEPRPFVDLGLDRKAGPHRLADAFAVGHGQHAGHGGIDQADLRIGLGPESGGGAREQLGVARHLRMDFKADHDLPVTGSAGNAVGGCVSHGRSLEL